MSDKLLAFNFKVPVNNLKYDENGNIVMKFEKKGSEIEIIVCEGMYADSIRKIIPQKKPKEKSKNEKIVVTETKKTKVKEPLNPENYEDEIIDEEESPKPIKKQTSKSKPAPPTVKLVKPEEKQKRKRNVPVVLQSNVPESGFIALQPEVGVIPQKLQDFLKNVDSIGNGTYIQGYIYEGLPIWKERKNFPNTIESRKQAIKAFHDMMRSKYGNTLVFSIIHKEFKTKVANFDIKSKSGNTGYLIAKFEIAQNGGLVVKHYLTFKHPVQKKTTKKFGKDIRDVIDDLFEFKSPSLDGKKYLVVFFKNGDKVITVPYSDVIPPWYYHPERNTAPKRSKKDKEEEEEEEPTIEEEIVPEEDLEEINEEKQEESSDQTEDQNKDKKQETKDSDPSSSSSESSEEDLEPKAKIQDTKKKLTPVPVSIQSSTPSTPITPMILAQDPKPVESPATKSPVSKSGAQKPYQPVPEDGFDWD